MNRTVLEVKGLTKRYQGFTLQDISLTLPAGYIMGYIGQNGAGKTTTLNAITHLIRPDAGETTVNGITFARDPVSYRDSIGYIGDAAYFPPELTLGDVRKILKSFYPSFDAARYDVCVRQWNLPEKEKIKNYSRGMKVKLMFAAVLSRDTKLLILDEATNGLDPIVRREVLRLLQEYIADGTRSVLFSTHIMEDLQDIADYIFFIDRGKKIFCEPRDDLLERYLLVKGGMQELTPRLEKALIGVEKHSFGFEGLFDTDGGEILPAGVTVERPTIDAIVVQSIEGAK